MSKANSHRLFGLALCAGLLATSTPANAADPQPSQLERGEYLVNLLSCAACHTDGQLINKPRVDRYLAGSSVGIAYTDDEKPGVVYPANLTPDPETGLGRWSREEIMRNIRYGIDRHGRQQLPIMPWPGYAHMDIEDAEAITAYLMSLKPIKHEVPKDVAPNETATSPYVRYGVYVFYPNQAEPGRLKPSRFEQ
jgi:mono/diheme cytochrome c family protein